MKLSLLGRNSGPERQVSPAHRGNLRHPYEELDGHVARYAHNRALLLDGLPRLGITRLAPADGGFYVYADVGHRTHDSMAFCHDLLARTGVATAPGIDFDTVDVGRFVRLSFAGPGSDIEAALERLSTALDR